MLLELVLSSGERCGGRPAGRRGRRRGRGGDAAVAEADLDQVVEDPLVARRGADPGVDDGGRPGEPRRDPGVPQVPAQQPAYGRPVQRRRRRPGRRRRARAAAARPARMPGGDRVVDALTGHRVDQAGGVAGQQHRPVGLLPAPARERQVVAAPVGRPVGTRAGHQRLELVEQQLAGRRRRRRAPEQLAVPDVGQPVAAVEGPGVRRLAAVAVHGCTWRAAPPGGRGRVAADRERAAACRR